MICSIFQNIIKLKDRWYIYVCTTWGLIWSSLRYTSPATTKPHTHPTLASTVAKHLIDLQMPRRRGTTNDTCNPLSHEGEMGGRRGSSRQRKRGLFASVHWGKHRMAAKWVTTAKQSTRVSKKHILTKADADASPSTSSTPSPTPLLMLSVCTYVTLLLPLAFWPAEVFVYLISGIFNWILNRFLMQNLDLSSPSLSLSLSHSVSLSLSLQELHHWPRAERQGLLHRHCDKPFGLCLGLLPAGGHHGPTDAADAHTLDGLGECASGKSYVPPTPLATLY